MLVARFYVISVAIWKLYTCSLEKVLDGSNCMGLMMCSTAPLARRSVILPGSQSHVRIIL